MEAQVGQTLKESKLGLFLGVGGLGDVVIILVAFKNNKNYKRKSKSIVEV